MCVCVCSTYVCLLLQDLYKSCARGGWGEERGRVHLRNEIQVRSNGGQVGRGHINDDCPNGSNDDVGHCLS